MSHWGALSIAIVLNATAHFMIKNSSIITEMSKKKIGFFVIGASCFGISLIFYTLALSKIKLVVAFPLSLGLGALLTTFLAMVFLNEKMSIMNLIGLVCIIGGAYLVTAK